MTETAPYDNPQMQPTMHLRWYLRKGGWMLQQCFLDYHQNRIWFDIPLIDDEQEKEKTDKNAEKTT